MTPKKDLELYLHIPFCKQKCRYCDFLSAPLGDANARDMSAGQSVANVRGRSAQREDARDAGGGQQNASATDAHIPEAYVDALIAQIVQESQFYQGRRVTTIFWGGGTPSLLRVCDLERLMDTIRTHFCVADDAEITLESNPGTLDYEKLSGYRRAGINRLSMGLQSACDKELAMLGRIHNFDTFVKNYEQARRAGFENINVDLMSALPGQTVESWEQTLTQVAELAPEHLSAYSLIIEEGTPFWNWYGEDADKTLRPKGMLPLPSEEDERLMYARTREILERYGYHRYEISNYAKDGYACRHNIGYWNRTDYLGLGLGASSLIDPVRWKMTSDLSDYLEYGKKQGDFAKLREEVQTLTVQEQMEEFMFLGLRLTKGIELQTFEHQFEKSFWDVYQDAADRLFSEKLICLSEDKKRLRLTDYGVDVSNYALAEFLLDN